MAPIAPSPNSKPKAMLSGFALAENRKTNIGPKRNDQRHHRHIRKQANPETVQIFNPRASIMLTVSPPLYDSVLNVGLAEI